MAVSVRIEDEAFSDRRYDVLAHVLGLPDADCARGKMAAIWRQCTQQQTHVLNAELVRVILGEKGPDALIKSTLGEPVDGGIRIRGTRGRIEWLGKLRKNAKKGGEAKAAKRQPNRQASGSANGASDSAKADPKPCSPAPSPAPSPVLTQEEGDSPPARPSSPHQQAIAEFHGYYQRAHGGSSPTWNGKNAKLMSELVKAHGTHEIVRRIAVLEKQPPTFPPAPWDMATFSQHFDKLAQASTVSATRPTERPRQIPLAPSRPKETP